MVLAAGITILTDGETEAQRGTMSCLNPILAGGLLLGGSFADLGKKKPCILALSTRDYQGWDVERWEKWEIFQKKSCRVLPPRGKHTWGK